MFRFLNRLEVSNKLAHAVGQREHRLEVFHLVVLERHRIRIIIDPVVHITAPNTCRQLRQALGKIHLDEQIAAETSELFEREVQAFELGHVLQNRDPRHLTKTSVAQPLLHQSLIREHFKKSKHNTFDIALK